MIEPIEVVYIYKDNYNTKPVDFGSGVVFQVGEIHMDKRVTVLKDDMQIDTYTFTCKDKAIAWTGKPIDEGFNKK